MHIYFATSSMGDRREEALRSCGVKNLLVSYAYKNAFPKTIEFLEPLHPDGRLIVDSGAFTAWSKGESIDLQAYGEFCLELLEKVKGKIHHVYVINLDVIPGEMGKNPTADQIHSSAEKGFENLEKLEKIGLKPIHIFHQFEDFKWLDVLAARQPYIGISPSNACSVKERHNWLRHVFYHMKDKLVRTHGFGVTAKKLMEDFPWYSVDSSSWAAVDIYGRGTFTTKKHGHETWFNSRMKSHRDKVLKEEIRELLRLEKSNTELWKMRGVDWEKRDRDENFI